MCTSLCQIIPQLPPCTSLFPYTTLFRSHTFSAQFAEASYDESEDAAVLARKMRTKHVPVRTDEETLRSEEHTSELQSPCNLVCRLLLEKNKCTQYGICMITRENDVMHTA